VGQADYSFKRMGSNIIAVDNGQEGPGPSKRARTVETASGLTRTVEIEPGIMNKKFFFKI
jgi:hypothetical protein